jgi:hypothetical protein
MAQFIKLNPKVNNGAAKYTGIFAFLGITISLIINFSPSAIGCKRPQNPTMLGPFLLCIDPIALRSPIV